MLLQSLTISPLPKEVKMGNKTPPKYYKQSDKLPLHLEKLKNQSAIYIDKQGFYRGFDKKKIIKNSKTNQSPHMVPINGQVIYNNLMHFRRRNDYIIAIKDVLRPFVKQLTPITQFPIKLTGFLYREIGNGLWDLDNLWIYGKVIQDLMVEEGIIPNDNIRYISLPLALEYTPVLPGGPEMLMIMIEHDENLELIYKEMNLWQK